MTTHSIDVTYAYAQLGLDVGAPLEAVEAVLVYARAYRFATRDRIKTVEKFVEFFTARDQLGVLDEPFSFIRDAYRKKAMMLHPDRNNGNKAAEEQLKLINVAFALINAMHREARDYYRQNEEVRRETEKEAREATARERPAQTRAKQTRQAGPDTEKEGYPHAARRPGMRYAAASIPRHIRTARLSHLPVSCVIDCWYIASDNDINYIFDIIMLPEREFLRARMHLATPGYGHMHYTEGHFMPPYIPKDVKIVTVPEGERNPDKWAKEYFLKEFGVEGKKS